MRSMTYGLGDFVDDLAGGAKKVVKTTTNAVGGAAEFFADGVKTIATGAGEVVIKSLDITSDAIKSVGSSTVKFAKKELKSLGKIAYGVGDILTLHPVDGIKNIVGGAWDAVTAPVTLGTNIVDGALDAFAINSEACNALLATVTGIDRRKNHDVMANLDKANNCVEEVRILATTKTENAREAIREKVKVLLNTKGFSDFVYTTSAGAENIFDPYFDDTANMFNDFADILTSAVNKIKDYSNASGVEKIFDTALMAGTKFGQGVLKAVDVVGDAGITAFNWVGFINDDDARDLKDFDWTSENPLYKWAVKTADKSAFTEDSLLSGAYTIAGEVAGGLAIGTALAPIAPAAIPTALVTNLPGTIAVGRTIKDYFDNGGADGYVDRITGSKMDTTNAFDKSAFLRTKNDVKKEIEDNMKTQPDTTPTGGKDKEDVLITTGGTDDDNGGSQPDGGQQGGGYQGGGYQGGGYQGGGYQGGGYQGGGSQPSGGGYVNPPTGGGNTPIEIPKKDPNDDVPVVKPEDEPNIPDDDEPSTPVIINPPTPPIDDTPSNPGGGEVYTPVSDNEPTTIHSGGGYTRTGGYTATSDNTISTPGTGEVIKNNVTKGKTSVDDIIKGSKYTKIPTNTTPIKTTSSSNGLGSVIPIAAGLSAAAAAGIGAKAYLDHKKNNDNDENDEFGAEEWNGDEDNIEIDYDDSSDTQTEQYLDDDDSYEYQS